MTRNFEEQQELRKRLLSYVVRNLNEHVIHTAADALRDLLIDFPEVSEELLGPIFKRSEFWPNTMAKEALGLPSHDEYETEELLRKFENNCSFYFDKGI